MYRKSQLVKHGGILADSISLESSDYNEHNAAQFGPFLRRATTGPLQQTVTERRIVCCTPVFITCLQSLQWMPPPHTTSECWHRLPWTPKRNTCLYQGSNHIDLCQHSITASTTQAFQSVANGHVYTHVDTHVNAHINAHAHAHLYTGGCLVAGSIGHRGVE